ncbi:Protein QUIRKY [Arachis hypogaea]|uniref:Protein QUIRKY n=1 Tax=Arachis hypogaea TaxID=3818 RepID=A0A6B9VAR8_ARAHY|nr:Protein QUIRKY [Arachis hypogaea]
MQAARGERVKILKKPSGTGEGAYIRVQTSSHHVELKLSSYRPNDLPMRNHQVFALSYNKTNANTATLEISIWDSRLENFFGGICFDLFDVPVCEVVVVIE